MRLTKASINHEIMRRLIRNRRQEMTSSRYFDAPTLENSL